MAKPKPAPKSEEEPKVCENCGTLMVQDDEGTWYCPKCDAEIDCGMEDDNEE